MIKNYLFDLDGTLLPLDEQQFLDLYLSNIGNAFAKLGHNPKLMVKRLWAGTEAMVKNDGIRTNEDVFWDVFYPEKVNQETLKDGLIDFYKHQFIKVKAATSPSRYSNMIVQLLKQRGANVYLLTNPIFPKIATRQRIEWAGLTYEDFDHVTTYENSNYAKPNLKYYQDILHRFNLKPEETMMVGNDVNEDMIAENLGMETYLVTECIKNPKADNIERFKQGTLKDFFDFINQSY